MKEKIVEGDPHLEEEGKTQLGFVSGGADFQLEPDTRLLGVCGGEPLHFY